MKPIDKLAHKYALNINQIRGPTSSKKLDFKNLNIGFYDSIAKNDISIKKNQTILKRVKDSSMKEFIYSNREIPMNWKHKQDYRDNLLKIMVKDKKVLKYIGMGEYKEEDNPSLKNLKVELEGLITEKKNLTMGAVIDSCKSSIKCCDSDDETGYKARRYSKYIPSDTEEEVEEEENSIKEEKKEEEKIEDVKDLKIDANN